MILGGPASPKLCPGPFFEFPHGSSRRIRILRQGPTAFVCSTDLVLWLLNQDKWEKSWSLVLKSLKQPLINR